MIHEFHVSHRTDNMSFKFLIIYIMQISSHVPSKISDKAWNSFYNSPFSSNAHCMALRSLGSSAHGRALRWYQILLLLCVASSLCPFFFAFDCIFAFPPVFLFSLSLIGGAGVGSRRTWRVLNGESLGLVEPYADLHMKKIYSNRCIEISWNWKARNIYF